MLIELVRRNWHESQFISTAITCTWISVFINARKEYKQMSTWWIWYNESTNAAQIYFYDGIIWCFAQYWCLLSLRVICSYFFSLDSIIHQFFFRSALRWALIYYLLSFISLFCRGTSGIDIDLRRVDIDQCPQLQVPGGNALPLNIFAGTDKCKAKTTEVIYNTADCGWVFVCLFSSLGNCRSWFNVEWR